MEITKCEVCGKEFKNIGVHMRKHAKVAVKDPGHAPSPLSPTDLAIEKLSQQMNSVVDLVGNLAEKVSSMEHKEAKLETFDANTGTTTATIGSEEDTTPQNYVPRKWRQLVDEILSPEFGITINEYDDRMDFQVNIIVPDKFTSISKEEREKGVIDIRSKVISRAVGENGVREWCQKIRNNLSRFYLKEGKQSPFK